MRADIQFLQDDFLALKTLYFRNWSGFCLRRVETLELDISKDEHKNINFISSSECVMDNLVIGNKYFWNYICAEIQEKYYEEVFNKNIYIVIIIFQK